MPNDEQNSGPAFITEEPSDDAKNQYSFRVNFLGQPPLWFQRTDHAIEVQERLNKGESLQSIQENMTFNPNTASTKKTDNMVNVPGKITKIQRAEDGDGGNTEYIDPNTGKEVTRVVPSQLTTKRAGDISGATEGIVRGLTGSVVKKVFPDLTPYPIANAAISGAAGGVASYFVSPLGKRLGQIVVDNINNQQPYEYNSSYGDHMKYHD